MTSKTLHGVVNGKTIELVEELGVPAGQKIELVVTLVTDNQLPCGEGLRRCAGSMAEEWTEEDDRILEEIYQERKRDTRPEPGE